MEGGEGSAFVVPHSIVVSHAIPLSAALVSLPPGRRFFVVRVSPPDAIHFNTVNRICLSTDSIMLTVLFCLYLYC